jgi:hypothetical protein
MTKENQELRDKVKAIELEAVQCLGSQPQDDYDCERHLKKCLGRIAEMASDFCGIVEVEACDIKWAGGEKGMPSSAKFMVRPIDDISHVVAARLEERFGRKVETCKWRMA